MSNNKKGPLSKTEKEIIATMFLHGDDLETIADTTKRSKNVIVKYMNSVKVPEVVEAEVENKNSEASEESPNPLRGKTGEMFARKEDYGVVAMTESASVMGDETRSQRVVKNDHQSPPRYHRHIHKIKED